MDINLSTVINKFGLIAVLSVAAVGCHTQYKGSRAVGLDGGSAKMRAYHQFKEQLHQQRSADQDQEPDKEKRTQPVGFETDVLLERWITIGPQSACFVHDLANQQQSSIPLLHLHGQPVSGRFVQSTLRDSLEYINRIIFSSEGAISILDIGPAVRWVVFCTVLDRQADDNVSSGQEDVWVESADGSGHTNLTAKRFINLQPMWVAG